MLFSDNLLISPQYWFVPWILQAIAYYFVLKKMGLRKWTAVIPVLAEREMSTVLFRRMRTFYRPVVIAAVFLAGAYYLGSEEETAYIYMLIANVVYGLFLVRLYYRLSKSFGKGIFYTILMVLFPALFLLILGLGKSRYTPLEFREERQHGLLINSLRKITVVLISAVEIVALVLGVGIMTIRTLPPRPLVNSILKDVYEESKNIVSDGNAVGRDETMGDAAASVADMPVSREKFFPDHSGDKSVVVMEYIIGADLEDHGGMASANISMMKDATKKGDALTFVLEAGGSRRWFTSGITENGYGRYTVRDGKIEKVMDLEGMSSMEEPANLEDFIKWTAENYPADRYMLVLWDHGGGVPYGYGVDQLQHRTDLDDVEGLRVTDVAQSIANTGLKFDLIGFDACLMQDIEIASSLEPYADYYLASEETEGGLGWFYTSSFGRLAAEPGLSTEEFGKDIIAAYDQFNTVQNDGEPMSDMTLSLVDLTRVKPAYEKLSGIFAKADNALKEDQKDFAEFGLAAMNSYSFVNDLQLDVVDLLDKLEDTDMDDTICTEEELNDAVNAIKACIVYRNRNTAEGINGMSVAFPYKSIKYYNDTRKELDNLKLDSQTELFNDVFSVIAAQKKAEHDSRPPSKYGRIGEFIDNLMYVDYTQEEWYVKGFEDYEPDTTLVDIPVTDTGEGYSVQLPDKTWDIIADCVTVVYQKTEDGRLRYLGFDHFGDDDANGHPMVDMDDRWVHINDKLVCYEDNGSVETENGTVFTGDVKARLNGEDDILIHVQWDAASGSADGVETGHVTGYDFVSDEQAFMKKGTQKFSTGDKIEFLFDYYDEEGNLIGTEPSGSLRVTTMDRLKVADSELEDCDIQFLGKFLGRLTDAYQRQLLTDVIEAHIGD